MQTNTVDGFDQIYINFLLMHCWKAVALQDLDDLDANCFRADRNESLRLSGPYSPTKLIQAWLSFELCFSLRKQSVSNRGGVIWTQLPSTKIQRYTRALPPLNRPPSPKWCQRHQVPNPARQWWHPFEIQSKALSGSGRGTKSPEAQLLVNNMTLGPRALLVRSQLICLSLYRSVSFTT